LTSWTLNGSSRYIQTLLVTRLIGIVRGILF